MDRILIENWNKVVSKEDEVNLLGDFSWGNATYTKDIIEQLNGDINFITGNHDQVILKNHFLKKLFKSVNSYSEEFIDFNNKMYNIVSFHYPITEWNRMFRGAIHLHGHTHGNFFQDKGLILDVGLDGPLTRSDDPSTYRPLELSEILDYMKTRELNYNKQIK